MKTEHQLNADILKITLTIQEKYPLLSSSIEEMTETIPDKEKPEINNTHLQNYYNSLLSMLVNYKNNSSINSHKYLSSFWKLILSIIICESIGIISALLANANNNAWFDSLNKPTWNPDPFLFAPIWTTLYFLMGISFWLIWKNKAAEINKRNQYYLFTFQLILNFIWSILFFKLHSPVLAFADIILMLIIITLTIFSFSLYSKPSAWLLVPYIAWVLFATILNYSIWNLNN